MPASVGSSRMRCRRLWMWEEKNERFHMHCEKCWCCAMVDVACPGATLHHRGRRVITSIIGSMGGSPIMPMVVYCAPVTITPVMRGDGPSRVTPTASWSSPVPPANVCRAGHRVSASGWLLPHEWIRECRTDHLDEGPAYAIKRQSRPEVVAGEQHFGIRSKA